LQELNVFVPVHLDDRLIKTLKLECQKQGISVNAFICNAIWRLLDERYRKEDGVC
jgi:predicted HicB family RNase H-like nuclease